MAPTLENSGKCYPTVCVWGGFLQCLGFTLDPKSHVGFGFALGGGRGWVDSATKVPKYVSEIVYLGSER